MTCNCNVGQWTGDRCQTCPSQWTGANCDECANGWTGADCNTCPSQWTGTNCDACATYYYPAGTSLLPRIPTPRSGLQEKKAGQRRALVKALYNLFGGFIVRRREPRYVS